MGRGNNNKSRGGGRKNIGPSDDPAIQTQVHETIHQFINDPKKPKEQEINVGGSLKTTYKYYCREMGVGWVRSSRRGYWKMIRFVCADPVMILWKNVWCFYFSHYCDVDLVAESQVMRENDVDMKNATLTDKPITCLDTTSSEDAPGNDDDAEEETAILRLLQAGGEIEIDDNSESDEEFQDSSCGNHSPELDSGSEIILDATSTSLDGKRMWVKVRDLLQEIKRNERTLWEELCSLGVNNCSERKLEPHLEQVQNFFDLQGNGPTKKIRGKKLRIAVDFNESLRFLDGSNKKAGLIEYAKPVKFSDTAVIKDMIRLVDKANESLGAKASSGSADQSITNGLSEEDDLPSNIFNDNWRKKRRYFDLGERFFKDNTDPIYNERKASLRKRLPAFSVGNDFCKKVFEHDVVVLCGATGCGKTTQLPQILMEEAAKLMHEQHSILAEGDSRSFGTGLIICTQPRRISATSVAERVCFERNEKMGDRVGYQIRFEQKASNTTELLYCTTGILLRFLVGNPKLEGISCVVIDEVHERGVHTDFVLLILKDLVLERKGTKEPLKIVLMSATIDATNFLKYFDPNSSINFNSMQSDDINDTDIIMINTENDSSNFSKKSPYDVSFMEIPGKTNYPIDEYFIEDLCQEIGPSLELRGRTPISFGLGKDEAIQKLRNSWASAEAVREKYNELGLQMKFSGKVDKYVWQNLSNALKQPFQLDVDLICSVVEHIEKSDALTANDSCRSNLKRRKCDADYLSSKESAIDDSGVVGSILIFVPGWQDITNVMKGLKKTLNNCKSRHDWAQTRDWNILPLHSMIPPKDQNKIFDKPSPNCRKIIVSTNLAETSITIEDVVYVIDPGLMKGTIYNPHSNIASLETFQVSRSNVQQRRGRAGRCQPGKFFKLYSQYEFLHEMRDHEVPEMIRIPVEELCLQVKALRLPGNLPVHHVLKKAIDPPKSLAIQNATQLLLELGAFEEIILHGGLCSEKMTPLGWKLSQIPVHPCLGKMLLLGSLFERYAGGKDASKQIQSSSTFTYSTGDNTIPSILSPLISICSTLSFKSPFVLPFGKEKEADTARKLYGKGLFSDHLLFAKVLDEYNKQMKTASRGEFSKWLGANFLSGKTLEMTDKIQQDLKRYLKDLENGGEDSKVGNTSFGDRQQSSSDDRQQYHFQLKSTPLLSAILACSLNISFLPANRKRICSLHGGSTCSAHPSSLLSSIDSMVNERAVWNKYKHLMRGKNTDKAVEKFLLDQPNKIFVMGWFERLKTSDVYLRDCTLFGDPLPLLLLLPNVKQRGLNCAKETRSSPYARDPTIFEVVGGKSSHGGDSSDPELLRKKQVKNDNLQQEPMLLLRVKDEKTAKLLNALRAKLASFFCAVFSRRATSNGSICLQTEENMRAVFSGLKRLIDKSHSHYAQDGRSKNIDADNDLLNEVMNLSNFAECVILDPNKSDEDDMNDDCLGNDDYDDVQNEEYYFGSENSSRSPNYNGSNQWNRGRGRGYHARGRGRGSQQMRRNNR